MVNLSRRLCQVMKKKFQSFTKFDDRLDTFYSQFLMEKEFESLWKVFILVFCLSHSQSSIERGFKTNNDFVVENQSEFSLMALRTVQDHMRAKEVTSASFKITKDLCKSVKLARGRYDDYKEKNKLEKKETDKDLKRKIVRGEIEDIRKKKRFLESNIEQLMKDADKYALNAAKEKDFQILRRSNDLRSLISTKMGEINELDKMEQSLLIRKESMV